jgi:DNA invertase Pin-like site-specific DNA recombinase
LKVAIYARYSSDNQRDASIADQLRVCRDFASRRGWMVVHEFTDHAISGATLLRSGFQALMRDALNQRFDIVLAEALDRFSRDQEDTAGLFKRLTFAGVNIVTLAEGDITHLHVGLKGTMNALFFNTPGAARSGRSRKVRRRSLLWLQGDSPTPQPEATPSICFSLGRARTVQARGAAAVTGGRG